MTAQRIWIVAGVIVIVAVLGLGWFLAIAPRLAEAATADADRAGVEQLNALHELRLTQLEQSYERIDDTRDELDELRQEVPDQVLLEDAIDAWSGYADAAGVRLTKYTAQEGYEVVAAAADGDEPAAVPSGLYAVPFVLEIAAGRDAFYDVVAAIQANERLTLVWKTQFNAADVRGILEGVLYVQRGVDAPAPAPTASSAADAPTGAATAR